MKLPMQIVFHNCQKSEAMEQKIRERAEKLERHGNLIGMRVTVDIPHKHHKHGNTLNIKVDMSVPDDEIVVTSSSQMTGEFDAVDIAIRDAFEAAKRRLDEYVERRRGLVKAHGTAPRRRGAAMEPAAPDEPGDEYMDDMDERA